MPATTEPTAADRAVEHILRRVQSDPNVRAYLGELTESFELLCAAFAERHGRPVESVKRQVLSVRPKGDSHYEVLRRYRERFPDADL